MERIIRQHGVRRVIWDGDPPEPATFSERFPELFRRLTDAQLVDEIKAVRLKGATDELKV